MSFVRGSLDGVKTVLDIKRGLTQREIQRFRAMAYYSFRLDGFRDDQIAQIFGRSRENVNRWINALPASTKEHVRQQRLRAAKADELLKLEESLGYSC